MRRNLLNRDDLDQINEHLSNRAVRDAENSIALNVFGLITLFGGGGISMYLDWGYGMIGSVVLAFIFFTISKATSRHQNDPHNLK